MKKGIVLSVIIGFCVVSAIAAEVVPQQIPEILSAKQQKEVINKVQGYLDGLKRLKADLVQTNANGTRMHGVLYLDRPGKMRLAYQGSSRVLMIADGEKFIYQDGNQEPTGASLDSTPAGILLQKSLKLQDNVNVLAITKWQDTVAVTLARPYDDDSMALTLMFKEQGKTLSLLGWSLRQQQNQTDVMLANQEVPKVLDPQLFQWGKIP